MVFLIVIPIVHGVVPYGISSLTPRFGWTGRCPGIWNWFGLVLAGAAITLLVWTRAGRFWPSERAISEGSAKSNTDLLQISGSYRFTRNPIYAAYLGLWLGWAVFFGSVAVLTVWLALCLVAEMILISKEERDVEFAFGDAYRRYKLRVPRWFGRVRHRQSAD